LLTPVTAAAAPPLLPADSGPQLEPCCLPASITRLCTVPAPGPEEGAHVDEGLGWPLPEQLLALPRLKYLDVSGGWVGGWARCAGWVGGWEGHLG
jgi:hypothetical protein